jgi:hypothetical protein
VVELGRVLLGGGGLADAQDLAGLGRQKCRHDASFTGTTMEEFFDSAPIDFFDSR